MIVIVYPQFFRVGGIARYLESFLANLPPDAGKIVLLTGEDPGERIVDPRVEVMRIRIEPHRFGLLKWSLRVRRLLAQWRTQGIVECINLHTPPMIPGVLIGSGIPMVWTAHSTYVGLSGRFDGNRNFKNSWNPVSLWIKVQIEKALLARATRVITLTEQGRQELSLYGDVSKVRIVPNGVDVSQFSATADMDKAFDVIFAGRIEKLKGSRPLVEVCRSLIMANPRIRIVVVGYGDDEEHVHKELAPFAQNVVLTGKVPFDEMVSYYHRSRIYASTSYHEGLPGTCLEAMAMGLPVVVWERLFYRNLVVDGATGLSAPVNDRDAMVTNILRLLADSAEASAMGARGRTLVCERYDWRRLSREVLEVLSLKTVEGGTAQAYTVGPEQPCEPA